MNEAEQTEKDEDLKVKLLLRQWEIASELHRHMDDMAWQRFNYFTAINGVLLAALAAVADNPILVGNSRNSCLLKVIAFMIPITGFFISSAWWHIQKRGQGYHRYRCIQAQQTERALKIHDRRILTLYDKGLNQYAESLEEQLNKHAEFLEKHPDWAKRHPYCAKRLAESLNEQNTALPSDFRRYLKSRRGKCRTHSLIGAVAGFFAVLWLVSIPFLAYFLFFDC